MERQKFSADTKTIKKNPMEFSNLKNTVSEIKNLLNILQNIKSKVKNIIKFSFHFVTNKKKVLLTKIKYKLF